MATETKKGMGLFAKIFIALVVIFFVMAGCVACGAYFLYRKVASFTAARATQIPTYPATQQEYDDVRTRLADFQTATSNDKAAKLELTANDINTLIALDPTWKEMKDKIHVRIADGQLSTDASIPLSEVPGFRNRYLNGSITLKISADNGILYLRPTAVVVNGQSVPAQFLKALQERNMAEQLNQDPKFASTREKIKAIKIEGNKIVIETTGAASTTPNQPKQ